MGAGPAGRTTETYALKMGDLTRELPLVQLTPNSRLPLVEFLGDAPLARAAALELRPLLPTEAEVLFTCETSSLPLVHVLAELTGLPYEVARKRRRPYMDDPIIQEVASMTLGVGETLWLGRSRAANLASRRVAVVLDVVASGGTVQALEKIVTRAGGTVCARLAAFTQGRPNVEIRAARELPIFDVVGR